MGWWTGCSAGFWGRGPRGECKGARKRSCSRAGNIAHGLLTVKWPVCGVSGCDRTWQPPYQEPACLRAPKRKLGLQMQESGSPRQKLNPSRPPGAPLVHPLLKTDVACSGWGAACSRTTTPPDSLAHTLCPKGIVMYAETDKEHCRKDADQATRPAHVHCNECWRRRRQHGCRISGSHKPIEGHGSLHVTAP